MESHQTYEIEESAQLKELLVLQSDSVAIADI